MSDLETRAGSQLYDILPEVYRSRDDGSLASWVDAAGGLLDLVRNTLEQRLADSFPDEPLQGRASQDWLLPYFAELLEPRLISSDPKGQRAEVANAIAWRQRKGTLMSAEQIAQEVGQLEAEVQEGWKRVAVTPRIGGAMPAADMPVGTVDFGLQSRALKANANDPAAHVTRFGDTVVPWLQANPTGAPVFPGSYEDASATTVDLREPDWRRGHAHPRRVLFYYPPQGGFFPPGAPSVDWSSWTVKTSDFQNLCALLLTSGASSMKVTFDQQEVLLERLPDRIRATRNGNLLAERIVEPDGRVRVRLLISGRWLETSTKTGEAVRYRGDGQPVSITGNRGFGTATVEFEGLSLTGKMSCSSGGRLRFRNCAAFRAEAPTADLQTPVIEAVDSLFESVAAISGLVRLEYVTVLQGVFAMRVQASDCLFMDQFQIFSFEETSVIRYSRLPRPIVVDPNQSLAASTEDPEPPVTEVEGPALLQSFNTLEPPLFVELDFDEAGKTVRRAAKFGEPGAGVLHPEAPRSIRLGAEDGGEMGAYHGRRYSLAAEAVRNKLEDYLPVGTEAVLIPDPRLLAPPPAG